MFIIHVVLSSPLYIVSPFGHLDVSFPKHHGLYDKMIERSKWFSCRHKFDVALFSRIPIPVETIFGFFFQIFCSIPITIDYFLAQFFV